MAEAKVLKAQARDGVGKGAARELRRQGLVPAVIYGDKKAPVTVSLAYKDAHKFIYAGGFLSHVLELDVDGTKHTVIPRDYQLDPVKDFPIHVDFLRVGKGTRLTVQVHVNFINEEASPGLKRGGTLNVVRHTVEVSAPADAIPEEITVDMTGFDIGDSVHISAVTLPKNVTPTITDRDFTIATIVAPSALKSAGDDGAEESEDAAGEAEAE
ncbi:50S ribosomal protein L25/general stress protein Ctc [Devosia sp. J2-20]|uniref:Large ribosomal subunit protein bL25 n=1 Tax=Devosia litorisediminis TaxID=2829817 RepID=A0A942I4L5_9HYPH|nr:MULTISPECIES: 50S ribosomal protein L25/general stress protein Ctc [Devosia]MBS3847506.1 50S ribosomal protein L25/general stress protein Ctc [Devosia litorisediminis]MCZ4347133.1 50S ribosomal protein L25/general stress protein Ctc [Devosia neptuniae]WDQ99374.1 50S ribosomal protein L25/general stress protein Ctc [Devosia sp. J2-20]